MTRSELLSLPVLSIADVMQAFGIKKSAAYKLMTEAGASKVAGLGTVITNDRMMSYINRNAKTSQSELNEMIGRTIYKRKKKSA